MTKQEYIDDCDHVMKINEQNRRDYERSARNYEIRRTVKIVLIILLVLTLIGMFIFDPFHNRGLTARIAAPCFLGIGALFLLDPYPQYPFAIPLPMFPIEGFEDE